MNNKRAFSRFLFLLNNHSRNVLPLFLELFFSSKFSSSEANFFCFVSFCQFMFNKKKCFDILLHIFVQCFSLSWFMCYVIIKCCCCLLLFSVVYLHVNMNICSAWFFSLLYKKGFFRFFCCLSYRFLRSLQRPINLTPNDKTQEKIIRFSPVQYNRVRNAPLTRDS